MREQRKQRNIAASSRLRLQQVRWAEYMQLSAKNSAGIMLCQSFT
jgi:hypothetical protein